VLVHISLQPINYPLHKIRPLGVSLIQPRYFNFRLVSRSNFLPVLFKFSLGQFLRRKQTVQHAGHIEEEHIAAGLHCDLHQERELRRVLSIRILFVDNTLYSAVHTLSWLRQHYFVCLALHEYCKRIFVDHYIKVGQRTACLILNIKAE